MTGLKERIVANWDLLRIMRMGIGLMMLVMAFQSRDWALGLFSGFFLYQAITNTGCCGARGCNTPVATRRTYLPTEQPDTTEYGEVK